MERRKFLKGSILGGVAAAASTLAAPAIAQSNPTIRWRMPTHMPKVLPLLWEGGEMFVRKVSEATDGKFQIQLSGPGEIVAPLEAYDAVTSGTVEMAISSMQYYYGKQPAFALMSTLAFGMNTRLTNAWMYEGGGLDLCNSILEKYNLFMLPAGGAGEQMGGWFRKEINTVDDLRGLRFRIPGIAGEILAKLGVVPQMIPGGDIYPALERGTIDATEFTSPYDDEKLGFVKVAPYYYFPTLFEPGSLMQFIINLEKWNELPKSYQEIVKSVSTEINYRLPAAYDVHNNAAAKRIIEAGAKLRSFSVEIQDAVFKATNDFYREKATQDADFKKLYEHMIAARDDMYSWYRVLPFQYDAMMIRLLNQA